MKKKYPLPKISRRAFVSVDDGENWFLINTSQVAIKKLDLSDGVQWMPVIYLKSGGEAYGEICDDPKKAAKSIKYFETQSPLKIYKEEKV